MNMTTPNSNKKTFIVAGTLAALIFVGGAAIAGGKKMDHEDGAHQQSAERAERRMERLASKLELSDEQKTQMQEIMQSNRERMKQQMQSNRENLKTELSTVLSAEQLEKFESIKHKRHGKRGGTKQDKE